MQKMQEIHNEHFVIVKDNNLGFGALGQLQDADLGGCCVPAPLTTWKL